MTMSKIVLLACGSYNPITNMHLRMFEIARDYLHRMGTCLVIGGLISPVHDDYGKTGLLSSTHRLEMVKLALNSSNWIWLSDWEANECTWTRTRESLQHHQDNITNILRNINNNYQNDDNFFESIDNCLIENQIRVKLLCGGDLLESFAVPGLWKEGDIEYILKHHGLVVISRENSNPHKFIYDSDLLTRYMGNIIIVTEWIKNEVSSTKIRCALRRNESIKYLVPDNVIEYIKNSSLYGFTGKIKYSNNGYSINSAFLTPSPSTPIIDSVATINHSNNQKLQHYTMTNHVPSEIKHLTIDEPDFAEDNSQNILSTTKLFKQHSGTVVLGKQIAHHYQQQQHRHHGATRPPGQAVKVSNADGVGFSSSETYHMSNPVSVIKHRRLRNGKESSTDETFNHNNADSLSHSQKRRASLFTTSQMRQSQSYTAEFQHIESSIENKSYEKSHNVQIEEIAQNLIGEKRGSLKYNLSKTTDDLYTTKSCDENLIKFIFNKHGIQVISDVETVV